MSAMSIASSVKIVLPLVRRCRVVGIHHLPGQPGRPGPSLSGSRSRFSAFNPASSDARASRSVGNSGCAFSWPKRSSWVGPCAAISRWHSRSRSSDSHACDSSARPAGSSIAYSALTARQRRFPSALKCLGGLAVDFFKAFPQMHPRHTLLAVPIGHVDPDFFTNCSSPIPPSSIVALQHRRGVGRKSW